MDNNPSKLTSLNNGEIPIYEPGLKPLFDRSVREGRLSFTDDLNAAVQFAQLVFLCFPTPPGADGQADLKYVLGFPEKSGSS